MKLLILLASAFCLNSYADQNISTVTVQDVSCHHYSRYTFEAEGSEPETKTSRDTTTAVRTTSKIGDTITAITEGVYRSDDGQGAYSYVAQRTTTITEMDNNRYKEESKIITEVTFEDEGFEREGGNSRIQTQTTLYQRYEDGSSRALATMENNSGEWEEVNYESVHSIDSDGQEIHISWSEVPEVREGDGYKTTIHFWKSTCITTPRN